MSSSEKTGYDSADSAGDDAGLIAAPRVRAMRDGSGESGRLADDVKARVRVFVDFPSPGIAFQDLCGVFADASLMHRMARAIVAEFGGAFDTVLAIEARGFVLGSVVSQVSGRPLALARKPGKLPGPVREVRYALEYGESTLQVQAGAVGRNDRVLVVDDVLATGGTLRAAGDLAAGLGGKVSGYAVILELSALRGRERLAPHRLFTVVRVED